jgi:hypothetical protein
MRLHRPASVLVQVSAMVGAARQRIHEPELMICAHDVALGAVEMCLDHMRMGTTCRECYDRHNELRHMREGAYICGICPPLISLPASVIRAIDEYVLPSPVAAMTGPGWPVEVRKVKFWLPLCAPHDEMLAADARDLMDDGTQN